MASTGSNPTESEHGHCFSEVEQALIETTPGKPRFNTAAEPLAKSFLDRMQSSFSEPGNHKIPAGAPILTGTAGTHVEDVVMFKL